ncbi:MAG: hypothetical protein QOD06_932, partial [Candidatus Binatota bacterium]|nr:hypothetical protein [Candidatus Binatota bacterium]
MQPLPKIEVEPQEEHTWLDDLEVGELATVYDDREPEDVIEWAFDRFGV